MIIDSSGDDSQKNEKEGDISDES